MYLNAYITKMKTAAKAKYRENSKGIALSKDKYPSLNGSKVGTRPYVFIGFKGI